MNIARNIHQLMKREAERRDLFLLKTNDAGYRTEVCFDMQTPFTV